MLEALANDANLWMLFSFVIFLFILVQAGKAAMGSVVDERIAAIKKELENAENLHTESQELLAQYQRKHANAVKEAEEIIENVGQYANKIRKQAKEELKNNLQRREEQLQERIERMKENAIVEIQRYAADIAIDATRDIILKEFDKKADKALIDESVKVVSTKIH